jgi:hypothetical protein
MMDLLQLLGLGHDDGGRTRPTVKPFSLVVIAFLALLAGVVAHAAGVAELLSWVVGVAVIAVGLAVVGARASR